jgi:hypothetical protein
MLHLNRHLLPPKRCVVALLAVPLLATACATGHGPTAATAQPVTTDVDGGAARALARFRAAPGLEPDDAVRAAADALVGLGVVDRALWQRIDEVGARLEPAPFSAAGASRPMIASPVPSPTPGILLAAMTATFGSAGDVATRALGEAVASGRPITTNGDERQSFADGRHRAQRGDDRTVTAEGSTLHLRTASTSDAQVCPDPDGLVVVEVASAVRLDVAGPTSGFVDLQFEVRIEGRLADDGTVVTTRFDGRQRVAMGDGSNDGTVTGGSFVESTTVAEVPAAVSDEPLRPDHYLDVRVVRRSSRVTDAAAADLALAQAFAADSIAAGTMAAVESYWRSGACVEVRLHPDAGPTGLRPGSDTTVSVDATARDDGEPTGGIGRASLVDGLGAVTPTTPIAVPGTIAYRAADANLTGGTVGVEVSSRRGIGRGRIWLSAGGAWRIDDVWQGFRVTGVVCSGSTEPWVLDVSGSPGAGVTLSGSLAITFAADGQYGTFTFTGSSTGGGMTFTNTSSGEARFRADLDGPGAILTIEPEQGLVTDGRNGRAGVEGVAELRAEPTTAMCG